MSALRSSAELIFKAASVQKNIRITTLIANILSPDPVSQSLHSGFMKRLCKNPVLEGIRRSAPLRSSATSEHVDLRKEAGGSSRHSRFLAKEPIFQSRDFVLLAERLDFAALLLTRRIHRWRILQRSDRAV